MDGWIKINRKIAEHWLWQDAERLKWWLDLLFMAAWEDKEVLHDAHKFTLHRGQMIASISFLAERWGRNNNTVIKYLKLLEAENMIIRKVLHRQTAIITICNYESYQDKGSNTIDRQIDSKANTIVDSINEGRLGSLIDSITDTIIPCDKSSYEQSDDDTVDSIVNRQVNTIVNGNKEIKEIKENNREGKRRKPPFHPPSLEDVKSYVQEKGYSVDAEQFVNFYESKGWMVGKNKMSNWHAAIATWQKREKERYGNFQQKSENRRGSLEVTATGEKDYSTSF